MRPIFADGIDIPMVLASGIFVLAPLMLFEILAEAALLSKIWHQPFRHLCRFTLRANCWSLLAGIPILFLSSWIYDRMVPDDLTGYSAREPMAFSVVAVTYLLATVIVEGATAFRWLRRNGFALAVGQTWKGVLLANLATYAVLVPLLYFSGRPNSSVHEFTADAAWSSHPKTKVIFIDSQDGCLKSVCVDGSDAETIVPMGVKDYLVSGDLKTCLFRDSFNNLRLYRRNDKQSDLVKLELETNERFQISQVAFSPAGHFVAFAGLSGRFVEVIDMASGRRVRQSLDTQAIRSVNPSIAWSSAERLLIVPGLITRSAVSILPDFTLSVQPVAATNVPGVFRCYAHSAGDDPEQSYATDSIGDVEAVNLDAYARSILSIHQKNQPEKPLFYLSVPKSHDTRQQFPSDVAFLEGGRECLFGGNGRIYLLDIAAKRVGMVARGQAFILLTERYLGRP